MIGNIVPVGCFPTKTPTKPQTNGMVERVNGTIKNATIKVETYKNIKELKEDLQKFLIYYNINRRDGSLRRELKVRTPYEAVQSWFKTEPKIFKISPDDFYATSLNGMV